MAFLPAEIEMYRLFHRLTTALLSAALLLSTALAGQTKNVFIVNIDGIRANEGIESGSLHLPCIWDSLRPIGSLYGNLFNNGVTVSNAAHSSIVTGAYQLLLNNDATETPLRPREPTLAECFRREFALPPEKAVYVSGKPVIWSQPVSTWPGYGYAWTPRLVATSRNDLETWDSTRAAIFADHPRLCYVLLAGVDEVGHEGDTAAYLRAIHVADSVVYEIWKLLNVDLRYRDSTLFLVTTDHGRHDDRHGGWKEHGCACHGCRHGFLLALGPEVKSDTVISAPREQTDIAPTVAELLDFPMPYARGRVLSEMLTPRSAGRPGQHGPNLQELNVSHSDGHSRSADVAADRQALHCVFSDNTAGVWQVFYARSTDRGNSWSWPVPVLDAPGVDYPEVALTSFGDSGLFVVAGARRWVPDETTSVWTARCRRSTSSGRHWQPEFEADSLGMVSSRPAAAALAGRLELVYLKERALVCLASRDSGLTFFAPETLSAPDLHYPQYPALALRDTGTHAVWQGLIARLIPDSTEFHNIWVCWRPYQTTGYLLTHNGTREISAQPSIEWDPAGNRHVAFAQIEDAMMGNSWIVKYTHREYEGDTWPTPVPLDSARVGCGPVVRASRSGRLFCVWSALSDGDDWYIAGTASDDSGRTWATPVRLTSLEDFSFEPRMAVVGDSCFIVWEDRWPGNWDIMFKRVVFASSDVAAPPRGLPAKPLSLSALPSPFRTSLQIHLSPGPLDRTRRLSIYDASGRLVASSAGPGHALVATPTGWVWNPRAGTAAGVYVARVTTPGRSASTHTIFAP